MAHTDELRWWTVTTKKTGRCLGGCRLKRSSEKVAKKLRAKCRSSVGGVIQACAGTGQIRSQNAFEDNLCRHL